jgi:hypothetical protein
MEQQLWCGQNLRDDVRPVTEEMCGWMKPTGGLWTSTKLPSGSSGWINWCLGEDFAGPEFDVWELTPDPAARVFTIDSLPDLLDLRARFSPLCDHPRDCAPLRDIGAGVSWRRVAEEYDAVRLTEEGQWRTRMSRPSLYGWDCESTLWFRWRFTDVHHVGARSYEGTSEWAT